MCTVDHMERLGGLSKALLKSIFKNRVEHRFLCRVLKRFGFGAPFIFKIKALYDTAVSYSVRSVQCNGLSTGVFNVGRSSRQGCPLSAMMFSIFPRHTYPPLSGDKKVVI